MKKPQIVIHPGFAKCATTTLQRRFQSNDFSLCHALGVVWLGREFKPLNGAPPVYDVVQGGEVASMMLGRVQVKSDCVYFLSAENLVNHEDVLEAVSEKFALKKAVFTVRFPPFIALSEFYFRGWLAGTLENALEVGLSQLRTRLMNRVAHVGERFFSSVSLCPIEQHDFMDDFCEKAFDEPHNSCISRDPFRSRNNASAQPCFIMALNKEYLRAGSPPLAQGQRRELIKMVQEYQTGFDSSEFLPLSVLTEFGNRRIIESEVESYKRWLVSTGCVDSQLEEVQRRINQEIAGMLEKRPAPPDLQNELALEARGLLRECGVKNV